MAGKTKLTKQLTDEVCKALKLGAYVETAAASVGIDRITLHKWLKKGAREADKGQTSIHRSFQEAIQRAFAAAELADLNTISQHADGFFVEKKKTVTYANGTVEKTVERTFRRDWQAAAWRLERKHADRWGKKLALAGHDHGPLAGRVVVELPDNKRPTNGVKYVSQRGRDGE